MKDEVGEILDFWFGELDEYGYALPAQRKIWFAGKEIDRLIEQRFGTLVARALAGDLDHWSEHSRSLMALVTLLDQFPRNIYRATPQAFSGDERAVNLVNRAIAAGVDRQMPDGWRAMFYMPLEHAESLVDQNLCVVLLELMLAECPEPGREYLLDCLNWARQHQEIVARFGRFPHRNKVLGREPSAAEETWMGAGGQNFGQ